MAAHHNLGDMFEGAFRDFQEELGMHVAGHGGPMHLRLSSGGAIPVARAHFGHDVHNDNKYSLLSFHVPHESGAMTGVTILRTPNEAAHLQGMHTRMQPWDVMRDGDPLYAVDTHAGEVFRSPKHFRGMLREHQAELEHRLRSGEGLHDTRHSTSAVIEDMSGLWKGDRPTENRKAVSGMLSVDQPGRNTPYLYSRGTFDQFGKYMEEYSDLRNHYGP